MKVATLNLRHDADRWDERLPLVVDALAEQDADLIALQEVALTVPQERQIEVGLRQRGLTYTTFVAPKWGESPREGIGIFVRGRLLEYEHFNLPEGNRIAQRVQVEYDGCRVHLANVHLHNLPRENEAIRRVQMRALLGWMRERAGNNWLLAGDFNALPNSETVLAATEWLASAYSTINGSDPVTHPTPLNPEREPGKSLSIDYILYDAGAFRPVEAKRFADTPHPDDVTLYPSDHYGICARFEVNK